MYSRCSRWVWLQFRKTKAPPCWCASVLSAQPLLRIMVIPRYFMLSGTPRRHHENTRHKNCLWLPAVYLLGSHFPFYLKPFIVFKLLISYPQYTQVFIFVPFPHSPDCVKLTWGLQMYSLFFFFLRNVYFEIRYLNEHSSYIEGLGLHEILRTLVEVFRPSHCYKWNHHCTCHIVDVFSPNLAQRFIFVLFSISVYLNCCWWIKFAPSFAQITRIQVQLTLSLPRSSRP